MSLVTIVAHQATLERLTRAFPTLRVVAARVVAHQEPPPHQQPLDALVAHFAARLDRRQAAQHSRQEEPNGSSRAP